MAGVRGFSDPKVQVNADGKNTFQQSVRSSQDSTSRQLMSLIESSHQIYPRKREHYLHTTLITWVITGQNLRNARVQVKIASKIIVRVASSSVLRLFHVSYYSTSSSEHRVTFHTFENN